MNNQLYAIETQNLTAVSETTKQQAITSLESGKVVYFPNYSFALKKSEQSFLSEKILDPKHKNISYDFRRNDLAGLAASNTSQKPAMQQFIHRFAEFSKQLIKNMLPQYKDAIQWGRTSYRPAEIQGRVTSKRKDDTRVHVDSFSATPVDGLRILRVFCNINPHGQPRVWHIGEPFSEVLTTFAPQIPPYSRTGAKLLKLIKATKTLRSPYDHYMLQLHDRMKLDETYQRTLTKHKIEFPPCSTWVVFTDHVSHAALSGQFLLEQTFYLPVTAMQDPDLSPLTQIVHCFNN